MPSHMTAFESAWDEARCAKLERALEEIVRVLGPHPVECEDNKCQGCVFEMHLALRIALGALGKEAERVAD